MLKRRKRDMRSKNRQFGQLTGDQIKSLCVKRNAVQLHLLEGRAWITYDDHDVIVESGETITIPAGKHHVIISSANRYKTISYQIA